MGVVICNILIAFHVICYFEGLVHLSGVFSKLPQGLVSLSLADNGITSKGECILLSYYMYATINFQKPAQKFKIKIISFVVFIYVI